ncbi:MAG: cadmium-translocating P-type ATPase [Desulfovibrionaceae bacterium]|nr:cadmium-translocating P-type ATPase [Desulfovibrionaceae bacterium]
MELSYRLQGLTCPNCAEKIRTTIESLPAVKTCELNLPAQTAKILLHTPASDIFASVKQIVASYEPEVQVSPLRERQKDKDSKQALTLRGLIIIGGALIFVLAMGLYLSQALDQALIFPFFLLAYLLLGYSVLKRALLNIRLGNIFDENFLMAISTLGAFVIGEYAEGCAVMLFYQIGEYFQAKAVERSRSSISKLMDIRPDEARILKEGKELLVDPSKVEPGDLLLVYPGEKIPLDGLVEEGSSYLDTRALTGESLPKPIGEGDSALSGCINQSGILKIRVSKKFEETTVSRILRLVEDAAGRKAPTENFITTFARWYTPLVVGLAVLLALIPPLFFGGLWAEWFRRGLVFLIVSCPCALVLSIPLTYFGGIGAAAKKGILIKGSNYLEALSHLHTVVFDKTGTLTQGTFSKAYVKAEAKVTKEHLLKLASKAEMFSKHPIAKSLILKDEPEISPEEYEELAGQGIRLVHKGQEILVGNERLFENQGISFRACDLPGTKVYVAENRKFRGCIVIADSLRPDSLQTVADLRQLGLKRLVMITGDESSIAKDVACKLKLDLCYAGLLPDQKVEQLDGLEESLPKGAKLAFVGDGINDAPVLARADVGIAMGGLGADAAIEAADVVLMTDEPSKLVSAIMIARRTKAIVLENIWLALGIKVLFLGLGAMGMIGLWAAVFGDVGVTLIAVANALRILTFSKNSSC